RNAETQNEHKWATQQALRLLSNRGRPGNANRLLAQSDLGFYGWHVGRLELRVYAGLYWDGDSSEAAAAARRLEDYASGAPAGSSGWTRCCRRAGTIMTSSSRSATSSPPISSKAAATCRAPWARCDVGPGSSPSCPPNSGKKAGWQH